MSSVRITVRWAFKEVKRCFTAMYFKRKLRVGQSPVGLLYVCALLLYHITICATLMQISQFSVALLFL